MSDSELHKVDEVVGEDGTRIIYVRERRGEEVKTAHRYVLPDYTLNGEQYANHQKQTNWINVLLLMVAFLTLLGGAAASWISIAERVAIIETTVESHAKSDQEAIGKIVEQVDTNTKGFLREHYEVDRKFGDILTEMSEIKRMLSKYTDGTHRNRNGN